MAVPADVPLLSYWDTKPHVVACTGDDDANDWSSEIDAQSDWYEILIAEQDERPIGVVQIIDPLLEATHYWGDVDPGLRAIDIWIGEESDLGRGHGTAMMTMALERCFAPADVTAVLIDPLESNVRAHRFYQRLGFEVVGVQSFGSDSCLVHRLDRTTWASR